MLFMGMVRCGCGHVNFGQLKEDGEVLIDPFSLFKGGGISTTTVCRNMGYQIGWSENISYWTCCKSINRLFRSDIIFYSKKT